jgi:hypothetical protein
MLLMECGPVDSLRLQGESVHGNDLVLVPCLDGQISVGKVITKAQQTYKDAFKVDIRVDYLRCHRDGAILNSKDKLADVVKNGAVLVACAPEDEPATTSNSSSSSNMQSQLATTQLVVMPNALDRAD